MKQRKEQTKKRMLYQAPYKSPIFLAIDTCSQSTCCTQSPSRAAVALCFTNSQPPTVRSRPTRRAPAQSVTSTTVTTAQPEMTILEQETLEDVIPSTPVNTDQDVKSPVIPLQNTKLIDTQYPQALSTPKRTSTVLSAPTTPRTPTIRPKNTAVGKPCTTPNRQQRRPEVQQYLETNLPRTPKKNIALKRVTKKTKRTTPKTFNRIQPLNKSNVDHDMLRYHYLTKSPSSRTSPVKTIATTSTSRVFEFQSSPRRANMFHTCRSAREAAKQSVLLTIRKVAQELAELRKRRQLLYLDRNTVSFNLSFLKRLYGRTPKSSVQSFVEIQQDVNEPVHEVTKGKVPVKKSNQKKKKSSVFINEA